MKTYRGFVTLEMIFGALLSGALVSWGISYIGFLDKIDAINEVSEVAIRETKNTSAVLSQDPISGASVVDIPAIEAVVTRVADRAEKEVLTHSSLSRAPYRIDVGYAVLEIDPLTGDQMSPPVWISLNSRGGFIADSLTEKVANLDDRLAALAAVKQKTSSLLAVPSTMRGFTQSSPNFLDKAVVIGIKIVSGFSGGSQSLWAHLNSETGVSVARTVPLRGEY